MTTIIDCLSEYIEKEETVITNLKKICNKMKDENEDKNEVLEEYSILYYHMFSRNKYFLQYLVLTYDIFDETCMIEIWQFERNNKEDVETIYNNDIGSYKKTQTYKLDETSENGILLAYASVLKKLTI